MSLQAPGSDTVTISALDQNMIERVNVGDSLIRSADLFGDRPALIEADRVMTYRELNAKANRLGHTRMALT